MSVNISIFRDEEHSDKAYTGILYITSQFHDVLFKAHTLERAWLQNKNNVSCVPAGRYPIEYEYSARFGKKLWELKGVTSRAEVKFHAANFWYNLEGCIALGSGIGSINDDGIPDLLNSKKTMTSFEKTLDFYTCENLKIDIYQPY